MQSIQAGSKNQAPVSQRQLLANQPPKQDKKFVHQTKTEANSLLAKTPVLTRMGSRFKGNGN
jgi:hypothetical protein